MPAAAMRSPPIPKRRQPGASARSAWHSAAPWRSPEASPAASMIDGPSAAILDTDERDPGEIGVPHARLPCDDEHAPCLAGHHRRAAGRGGSEALRAAAAGRASVVAGEAGRVLVVAREASVRHADLAGIAFVGV